MQIDQRIFCLLLWLVLTVSAIAQQPHPAHERKAGRTDTPLTLPSDVTERQHFSVVLGRPTAHSVTLNLLSAESLDLRIEFGPRTQSPQHLLATVVDAAVPREVVLDGLPDDCDCQYRILRQSKNAAGTGILAEATFRTRRPPGSRFVFELQGDSHPERPQQFSAPLYAHTLRHVASDHPDFYLMMGDDFSVDALHERSERSVTERYLLQRPFVSLVAASSPVFLVNGNHEQAAAANLDGTPDNVAVWAQNARNRLYPQPAPDAFYTGDAVSVPHIGLLRDYYAWTWGDALFVVIDPYWHSPQAVDKPLDGERKTRDRWATTLGEEQYQWFRRTLESSHAKYKFVFSHHVLGTGRGGVSEAGLFEWGGHDQRGRDAFAEQRPGWPLPIHPLMVKNGVTVFFQGHDHVFAREELDGVIYQTLPEPADPNARLYFVEAFPSGILRPNAGRVRVTVSPAFVQVDYLRSTPDSASGEEIAYSYRIDGTSH